MLEVERLGKSFGGLKAVQDVSFAVGRGEIVSLIGPNGAGKTTCFNLMTGFYRPDQGRVRFEAADITARRPQQVAALGMVRTFQKTNVLKGLSVRDNVLAAHYLHAKGPLWRTFLPGRRERATARDIVARTGQILDLLGLAARSEVPANALSCGELRLLEVGIALGARPKLLMLDEPAAGLNSREAMVLGRLLMALVGRWAEAILLVEHNMNLVMQVSQRIVVMNFGQKIAEGGPAEIQHNAAVQEAYIGKAT
jgi:branched-chain amino acid transport system ATP-binding protein